MWSGAASEAGTRATEDGAAAGAPLRGRGRGRAARKRSAAPRAAHRARLRRRARRRRRCRNGGHLDGTPAAGERRLAWRGAGARASGWAAAVAPPPPRFAAETRTQVTESTAVPPSLAFAVAALGDAAHAAGCGSAPVAGLVWLRRSGGARGAAHWNTKGGRGRSARWVSVAAGVRAMCAARWRSPKVGGRAGPGRRARPTSGEPPPKQIASRMHPITKSGWATLDLRGDAHPCTLSAGGGGGSQTGGRRAAGGGGGDASSRRRSALVPAGAGAGPPHAVRRGGAAARAARCWVWGLAATARPRGFGHGRVRKQALQQHRHNGNGRRHVAVHDKAVVAVHGGGAPCPALPRARPRGLRPDDLNLDLKCCPPPDTFNVGEPGSLARTRRPPRPHRAVQGAEGGATLLEGGTARGKNLGRWPVLGKGVHRKAASSGAA